MREGNSQGASGSAAVHPALYPLRTPARARRQRNEQMVKRAAGSSPGTGRCAMPKHELLDEQMLFQQGHFQRVRRWWRGIHPDRGTVVRGWSGWETVEEADRILPVWTFTVKNDPRS